MREILFRGKRVDNGEWVEGFYYKAKYYRTDKELYDFITVPHPNKEGRGNEHFMVISETVGQYTGLTDKNGKKIFEDDIVKVTDDNGETKYCSCGIGYVLFCYGAWYVDSEVSDGLYDVTRNYYIEVIGNIHDNPELLKEGGKG